MRAWILRTAETRWYPAVQEEQHSAGEILGRYHFENLRQSRNTADGNILNAAARTRPTRTGASTRITNLHPVRTSLRVESADYRHVSGPASDGPVLRRR